MCKIVVLDEKERSQYFYDIHDNQNDTYCIVKINVKKFYYNQDIHIVSVRHYFDVSYEYTYVVDGKVISNDRSLPVTIQKTNPFYNYRDKISDDSLKGVIVLSNRVTNAIIEQLLMIDNELYNEISNMCASQYRGQLMYILSTFWD